MIKGTVTSAARLSADAQLRVYWRFAVVTAAMVLMARGNGLDPVCESIESEKGDLEVWEFV